MATGAQPSRVLTMTTMTEKVHDQTLTCMDCGHEFRWTVGEQVFFANHTLIRPKRCGPCRRAKRPWFEIAEQQSAEQAADERPTRRGSRGIGWHDDTT